MVLAQGRGIDDVREWAVSQLPLGPRLYPKVHTYEFALPRDMSFAHRADAINCCASQCAPCVHPTIPSDVAICPGRLTWYIARTRPYGCSAPQDVVAQQPERFFVAEILREKIFLQYSQEVPYCTAVRLEHLQARYAGTGRTCDCSACGTQHDRTVR